MTILNLIKRKHKYSKCSTVATLFLSFSWPGVDCECGVQNEMDRRECIEQMSKSTCFRYRISMFSVWLFVFVCYQRRRRTKPFDISYIVWLRLHGGFKCTLHGRQYSEWAECVFSKSEWTDDGMYLNICIWNKTPWFFLN